ncbi:MAG TPA: DNA methyltransferase, partial [Gemmatimonadaceae bacterium]|nr:DNA methyltransferase [Gemmatimonadaceae bacterium]
GADVEVHARWLEILGRDALTARFYQALEELVRQMAAEPARRCPPDERRALALLHVSRLIFLAFLETRGWLDGDARFLARAFERCLAHGGGFQKRVLHPLFFGTLNTPVRNRAAAARAFGRLPFLNGGLFSRTALERRHPVVFSDNAFGALFDTMLLRYRFTPREERADLSECAVDPEMLGRAFESLMSGDTRRNRGAYYTPLPLVSQLVDRGLAAVLRGRGLRNEDIARALAGKRVHPRAARELHARLTTITIVDPACGSGAFLVYALERVAGLLSRLGDPGAAGGVRRGVLARSIFGVDVDPTAAWLCELRLWLSVVVEQHDGDPCTVEPLPNLDRQIRVGDSLAGEVSREAWRQPGGSRVARLRERYARASGANKRTAALALERAERLRAIARSEAECAAACAARKELLGALRARDLFGERSPTTPDERARLTVLRARVRELRADLRRLRDGGALPFAWRVHAGDVLDAGGFDLVIGNPPWVRLHRIPPEARAALRARFTVYARGTWSRGMEVARAGYGFAAQVDLAALFAERAVALTRGGGAVALLLPSKLWRSLAGGGVRSLLRTRTTLELIEDWSEGTPTFDAAVYPSGIVAVANMPNASPDECPGHPTEVASHRAGRRIAWRTSANALPAFADDAAAPWLLLPPEARAAFDRLRDAGLPLADTSFGSPMLGVKSGCNDAFIVRARTGRGELAEVSDGSRNGVVERSLLRPLVRGETLGRDVEQGERELILWTHDVGGAPLRRLPRHAARWLAPHEDRLRRRSDLRAGMPWWSLFRTPSAHPGRTRLVWSDVSREPRVSVVEAGDPTVALNSCYVLPCAEPDDAHALAVLLRSPVCAAWLRALAEPARGGYLRHLAWTVALLPIPRNWTKARRALLTMTDGASQARHARTAARAYGLTLDAVAPLIEWGAV